MKKGLSGAVAFCCPIHEMHLSAIASEKCQFGSSCGFSIGVVFSKSGGFHWFVSPPWKPHQYSKPSPVGQRSKGPAALIS